MLALFGGSKSVTEILPPWPYIDDDEILAVEKVLRDSRTDWRNISSVMGGGIVGEFEQNLAAFFGVPYTISTNSGGAALHIAVIASGVESGDEVIVSPYSWGQTAACILHKKGDCPVAEARGEKHDLAVVIGPNVISDQAKLIDQIADAFYKVTEQIERLQVLYPAEEQ